MTTASSYPQFQVVDASGNIINVFNGSEPGGGVSTEAKQDQILTALANLLTELGQKTEPSQNQSVVGLVDVDQGAPGEIASGWFVRLTDGSVVLGTGDNPLSVTVAGGAVEVSNFPASQTVDGAIEVSNFPATQPVSGTVTVANQPAQEYETYSDLGASAGAVVKVGTGHLHSISCYNAKDVKRYLQIFDSATVPATGDIPAESYPIGGESLLVLGADYFGAKGRGFTNGIAWGFSMSLETYAPAIASDQSTHVKFL